MNNLFPFGFLNITAPTSAGKTTLIKVFRQRFPTYLSFSTSMTTREITEEEERDNLYKRISVENFQEKIKDGFFLEWNQLKSTGDYYGTPFYEYERIKQEEKTVIGDLDNYGAKCVKEKLGNEVFNVYLMVSIDELRRRMFLPGSRVRNDPEKRLAYALEENNFAKEHEKTVFDLILPYDHRTPNEGVTAILAQIRKKRILTV